MICSRSVSPIRTGLSLLRRGMSRLRVSRWARHQQRNRSALWRVPGPLAYQASMSCWAQPARATSGPAFFPEAAYGWRPASIYGAIRSAGVQSKMSHSAIRTFIDSRSGLLVTSR